MNARLLYIVTHAMTARKLLRGQLAYMAGKEMNVFLITSTDDHLHEFAEQEGVTLIPVPIEREIHFFKDLITLTRLYRAIRKLRPDIVNASTPKAGFLGMIASWMAGVPVRIYTLRGLRFETKKGFVRFLLGLTERIASVCAHQVICVSESLRQRYLSLGFVKEQKIVVLGAGSSNGVDTRRFRANHGTDENKTLRSQLRIPVGAPVIGCVGRLTHDKGVAELLETFELLLRSFPDLHLLVLGDFEEGDSVPAAFATRLKEHPKIINPGFVNDTAPFYGIMDVLVFPSHREGFPNAPLEAAAAGIPAVGFRVTGTIDAIEDGVTGRMIAPYNTSAFAEAISAYLKDDHLRSNHGKSARDRVSRYFQQERVWKAIYHEYEARRRPARGKLLV